MQMEKDSVHGLKIAYIGGGSRGWAWNLMSDLAQEKAMSGEVWLYDIDLEAAKHNEIIGNKIHTTHPGTSEWTYKATDSIREALTGADFIVISILPGTFDEMESDVHAPEKYGIYQPVGDSVGPGGIIRALRTVPMYVTIAEAIRDYAPEAWVINYTNPMTMCVKTLYEVFPQVKAFGCCHEVFGTQSLLVSMLKEFRGIEDVTRAEIKTNVLGINHFTWINKAQYRNIDLFPLYREFVDKYEKDGYNPKGEEINWVTLPSATYQNVKMDLFRRYGYIAAAGDRHLSEFCPGNWYLADEDCVKSWNFGLTSVAFRRKGLADRLQTSADYISGKKDFKLTTSGEEGVRQMKAILGMGDIVTNVNMPNMGQISNMPHGMVVETNAYFSANKVQPIMAGDMPDGVLGLTMNTATNQEMTVRAALTRDLDLAFAAFAKDNLVRISLHDAKELFHTMLENTKAYLPGYKF